MLEQATPTLSVPALQAAGRYREPIVEQQIGFLLRCNEKELRLRMQTRDRSLPGWVQEEALVSLLRMRMREGNMETAWEIAEALIERSAGFIHKQVALWKLLSPQHTEDCIRDVQEKMLEDLLDSGGGNEFWEVRFWLCLKRRLINIVQKYRRVAENELYANANATDEDAAEDLIARIADPRAVSPQERAEVGEALALLPEQERIAFVLFHMHQWSQQEIAERLSVTDRTVRNLLTRADKRLLDWRANRD